MGKNIRVSGLREDITPIPERLQEEAIPTGLVQVSKFL